MMTTESLSYTELNERLKRVNSALRAIMNGEVDAVVRDGQVSLIRYTPPGELDSTDYYHQLFNSLDDMLFILNPTGLILHVNAQVKIRIGYEDHELKRMKMMELHPKDTQASVFKCICNVRENHPIIHEYPMISKDGLLQVVETRLTYGKWQQQDAVYAASRDILQHKQAESELKQTIESIEQSREKLVKSNAAKDRLFSIISHDLRNVFHPLLLSTNLLIKSSDKMEKESIQKFAQQIQVTANYAYKLMEDLLFWAKVQWGVIDLRPQRINISETSSQILSLFKTQALQKEILLKASLKSDCFALADVDMFQTILRNLISNAVKFTPIGGSIVVCVESLDQVVQIKVTDSGCGMDLPLQHKLFQIDQKVQRSGTSGEKGSGLGLILCKELVEKNKGSIGVDSHLGKGSTFWFTLPKYT
ncbi:MAG: PAS domain S-box protein [Desulfobacterales bacterium]|nr:PAS domain S-box protein [Desulfobacterales bacterium]